MTQILAKNVYNFVLLIRRILKYQVYIKYICLRTTEENLDQIKHVSLAPDMHDTVFFWKLTKVTPVLKDGNRNDCGNYRPISVISVVAEVFEKLVYQQLKNPL